jgi:hypothetical protein
MPSDKIGFGISLFQFFPIVLFYAVVSAVHKTAGL